VRTTGRAILSTPDQGLDLLADVCLFH